MKFHWIANDGKKSRIYMPLYPANISQEVDKYYITIKEGMTRCDVSIYANDRKEWQVHK